MYSQLTIFFSTGCFLSVEFRLQLNGCYLPYLLSTFFIAIAHTHLIRISVYVFVVSAVIGIISTNILLCEQWTMRNWSHNWIRTGALSMLSSMYFYPRDTISLPLITCNEPFPLQLTDCLTDSKCMPYGRGDGHNILKSVFGPSSILLLHLIWAETERWLYSSGNGRMWRGK